MKNSLYDLAFFSKKPAFESNVYVGRPNVGNRAEFISRIHDMLDRRWLSNAGFFVKEFEACIAKKLKVDHCIAICNATTAIQILVEALKIKGEVIVPSFTFVASAHALLWQNITPIFCDIDPKTHNLDPKKVEQAITTDTKAILAVHLWGRPCPIDELEKIAHKYQLKLIFDAAHAFNCSYKGQMIGNFGEAEVFSFHATKFLNSFEGGAITTNNASLAHQIRLMKNFGFTDYDCVSTIGINGKMHEASAAMGITNLKYIDEFISLNYKNYKQYTQRLSKIKGLSIIEYDQHEQNNYQYIVLELDESQTHLSRDDIITFLHAENILARRYFFPGCHKMAPYKDLPFSTLHSLRHTESLSHKVLVLPTGSGVSSEDIDLVCEILKTLITHGASIKNMLLEKADELLKQS